MYLWFTRFIGTSDNGLHHKSNFHWSAVVILDFYNRCCHPQLLIDLLKTLLLDLSLSSGDGRSGIGVDKAAALLAVLELSTLSRADANVGRVDLGAAGRVAIVISDASTGGELGVLAVADVLGTSVVGSQGKGRDGDWEVHQRLAFIRSSKYMVMLYPESSMLLK